MWCKVMITMVQIMDIINHIIIIGHCLMKRTFVVDKNTDITLVAVCGVIFGAIYGQVYDAIFGEVYATVFGVVYDKRDKNWEIKKMKLQREKGNMVMEEKNYNFQKRWSYKIFKLPVGTKII
eukprot:543129_1